MYIGNSARLIQLASSAPLISRATPVLAHPGVDIGHNTGGAITTHPAGFALVLDSSASTTPPGALGGSWTTVLTLSLDEANDVSIRVSAKVVTVDEGIPAAAAGSRRSVRVYSDYALDRNPVVDFTTASGRTVLATFAVGLDFEMQADGVTPVPGLVIGMARRAGSGTFTWASPLDNEPHNQQTSACAGSADSGVALSSWAGTTIAMSASNVEYCSAVILLAGELL